MWWGCELGGAFRLPLPVSLCQIPSESGVRCFVPARLSVPLCLAGEAAVINKTQEVECSPRCTHRRLHCITLWSESRHDFLLLCYTLGSAQPVVGEKEGK